MSDDREALLKIECAIGGAYEMSDGREFWIDAPVAREMARRVLAGWRPPQPARTAKALELASSIFNKFQAREYRNINVMQADIERFRGLLDKEPTR